MLGRRNKFEKVPMWSVVLGIILLCGVLSTTYGFYEINDAALFVSRSGCHDAWCVWVESFSLQYRRAR